MQPYGKKSTGEWIVEVQKSGTFTWNRIAGIYSSKAKAEQSIAMTRGYDRAKAWN